MLTDIRLDTSKEDRLLLYAMADSSTTLADLGDMTQEQLNASVGRWGKGKSMPCVWR